MQSPVRSVAAYAEQHVYQLVHFAEHTGANAQIVLSPRRLTCVCIPAPQHHGPIHGAGQQAGLLLAHTWLPHDGVDPILVTYQEALQPCLVCVVLGAQP